MFQKRRKKKLMAIIRKKKTTIMIWKRKKVLKNPKIMKKRDFFKMYNFILFKKNLFKKLVILFFI